MGAKADRAHSFTLSGAYLHQRRVCEFERHIGNRIGMLSSCCHRLSSCCHRVRVRQTNACMLSSCHIEIHPRLLVRPAYHYSTWLVAHARILRVRCVVSICIPSEYFGKIYSRCYKRCAFSRSFSAGVHYGEQKSRTFRPRSKVV